MIKKQTMSINEVASLMGKKGGKAGTGASKKRGNATYYRDMQRKSVSSRLKKVKMDES